MVPAGGVPSNSCDKEAQPTSRSETDKQPVSTHDASKDDVFTFRRKHGKPKVSTPATAGPFGARPEGPPAPLPAHHQLFPHQARQSRRRTPAARVPSGRRATPGRTAARPTGRRLRVVTRATPPMTFAKKRRQLNLSSEASQLTLRSTNWFKTNSPPPHKASEVERLRGCKMSLGGSLWPSRTPARVRGS